jgi:hypothetical protein
MIGTGRLLKGLTCFLFVCVPVAVLAEMPE